jgi:hypothetical protein
VKSKNIYCSRLKHRDEVVAGWERMAAYEVKGRKDCKGCRMGKWV